MADFVTGNNNSTTMAAEMNDHDQVINATTALQEEQEEEQHQGGIPLLLKKNVVDIRAEGIDETLLTVARGGGGRGDDYHSDDDDDASSSGDDSEYDVCSVSSSSPADGDDDATDNDKEDDDDEDEDDSDSVSLAPAASTSTFPSSSSSSLAEPSSMDIFPCEHEEFYVTSPSAAAAAARKSQWSRLLFSAILSKNNTDKKTTELQTIDAICQMYVLQESYFRRCNPHIPTRLATDAVLPHGTKLNIPKTNALLTEERWINRTSLSSSSATTTTTTATTSTTPSPPPTRLPPTSLATIPRTSLNTIEAFCHAYRIGEQVFRDANPSIPKDYGYEETLPRYCLIRVVLGSVASRGEEAGADDGWLVSFLEKYHRGMIHVLLCVLVVLSSILFATLREATGEEIVDFADYLGVSPGWFAWAM